MSSDKVFFRDVHTLILDDSEGMQRLIAGMLQGCLKGRQTLYRSAQRALEALDMDAFDLAIVDRELGGEDGLEFVRKMRTRRDVHQKIPVIVLSVNASREVILESLLSGANTVLRKPMSKRDLNAHIRRVLSDERIFVPFAGHLVPLHRHAAWQIGPEPSAAALIETLAAAVAGPSHVNETPASASAPSLARRKAFEFI